MLSLFPDLLDWSFYVPFFFRIFLSCYIIWIGSGIFKKGVAESKNGGDGLSWWILSGLLIILALSLLVGLFVQACGAITFVISILAIYAKHRNISEAHESVSFYLLFALVGISLVFLGPGPFAYDLPL